MLAAAREALEAAGELEPHAPLALDRPPVRHARSTIFVLAANGARWVVKQPDRAARQEDLAPPVSAAAEFASLVRLDRHFAPRAERMRVPRPVALLADGSALLMEYVAGPSVAGLLRPPALVRPRPLLRAIAAAGRALAHLHALELPHAVPVDTAALAAETLELTETTLAPLGIDLPRPVRAALADLPPHVVEAEAVPLHGDFAPVNVIVERRGRVALIDPSLERRGLPHDDLARFLTMLCTDRFFLTPGNGRTLRAAGEAFVCGYGREVDPTLLRLRLIDALCRRWVRRQVARRNGAPRFAAAKTRLVDAQFERLLESAAAGLATRPSRSERWPLRQW